MTKLGVSMAMLGGGNSRGSSTGRPHYQGPALPTGYGRSTRSRWDLERREEEGKIGWNQYADMVRLDQAERRMDEDVRQFQIQETRRQDTALFNKRLAGQKYQDEVVRNAFYQMQKIYMDAEDSPALQENILNGMMNMRESLNPLQEQQLSAFWKTGALKDQKLKDWDRHNPAPGVIADPETQPNMYFQQVGMRMDHEARRSAFATGDAPNLPDLRILQDMDGKSFGLQRTETGFVALNEQALDLKNKLPENYSLAQYNAEGMVTTKTDTRNIGGFVTETKSGYTLDGKTAIKTRKLGETSDVFRNHPQATMINSLKMAFATDGKIDDPGLKKVYKQTKAILDTYNKVLDKDGKPKIAQSEAESYLQSFIPDLNIRVYTEDDPKAREGFLADMWGFKDLRVSMFPGRFVDLGDGQGYFYDHHGNAGYNDAGQFFGMGTQSELTNMVLNNIFSRYDSLP